MNLDDILIDTKSAYYNSYNYNIIQLDIPQTYEKINIGVIIASNNKEFKIKTIDSIFKIHKFLNINNLNGIDFALNILIDRVLKYREILPGKISEILSVTNSLIYSSEKDIEKALEELYNDTITISKGLKKRNLTVNEYDKPKILKNLKETAIEKKFTTIEFEKKLSNYHKKIDTITFAEKQPIIAAEIVSPYIQEFLKSFGDSFMLMQELKANSNLDFKKFYIYMPIFKDKTLERKHDYKVAKNVATNNDIFIHDSEDYSEFLGTLEQITRRYSRSLFN